MPSAKEQIAKVLQDQPDDRSYDEILRELAFARMVERRDGTPHQDMAEVIWTAEAEHSCTTSTSSSRKIIPSPQLTPLKRSTRKQRS